MVPRETFSKKIAPNHDFIIGVISVLGTFFHTQTALIDQFGFQIKMPLENQKLLELIRIKIGLRSSVRIFTTKTGSYALLITRSYKEINKKVIPFVDDRLLGQKLKQYVAWKNQFNHLFLK